MEELGYSQEKHNLILFSCATIEMVFFGVDVIFNFIDVITKSAFGVLIFIWLRNVTDRKQLKVGNLDEYLNFLFCYWAEM